MVNQLDIAVDKCIEEHLEQYPIVKDSTDHWRSLIESIRYSLMILEYDINTVYYGKEKGI